MQSLNYDTLGNDGLPRIAPTTIARYDNLPVSSVRTMRRLKTTNPDLLDWIRRSATAAFPDNLEERERATDLVFDVLSMAHSQVSIDSLSRLFALPSESQSISMDKLPPPVA